MKQPPNVRNDNGRCLLRFVNNGHRYCLSFGSYALAENRVKAAMIAQRIWLDCKEDCFDSTLASYRTQTTNSEGKPGIISQLGQRAGDADKALFNLLQQFGDLHSANDCVRFFAGYRPREIALGLRHNSCN